MALDNVEGKTNKEIIEELLQESGIKVEFDDNLQTAKMKKGFIFTRNMSHAHILDEMVKTMSAKG
jgi:hypothetical protein